MSKTAEHHDRAAEKPDYLACQAQEAVNDNALSAPQNTNYVADCAHGHTLHILKEAAMNFVVMSVSLTAIVVLVLIDLWVLVKVWHLVFG